MSSSFFKNPFTREPADWVKRLAPGLQEPAKPSVPEAPSAPDAAGPLGRTEWETDSLYHFTETKDPNDRNLSSEEIQGKLNDVQKDIEENGRNNDNKESETYYKKLYYYRSREEKFNALTPEQREQYRELADLGTANPIKERVAFGNISMFKAWENLFKQIGSLPDAHAVKQKLKNAGVYDPEILEFATSLSNVSRNSKNLYESQ